MEVSETEPELAGVYLQPSRYHSAPAEHVIWRFGAALVIWIRTAELFKASRLAWIWFCKLGMADHGSAMAPAICGVAMDVPLAVV